jgi:hypothetical protein
MRRANNRLLAGQADQRSLLMTDQAEQAAAERWTEQLEDIAAVDRFTFQVLEMSDGQPVKDLNDLLRISGGSYRRNAKGIDGVMRF